MKSGRVQPSGDRVGDSVDEHGAQGAVLLRRGDARGEDRHLEPEQHGDPEDDEGDADDRRCVLGVVQQALRPVLGGCADGEEDTEEPGRDHAPHQEGPADRRPGLAAGGDPEEVHEVRGQQHEPARVDRGNQATDEAQGQVHNSSSSMRAVSCASSSWPVWSTMVPSAVTNRVTGKAATPAAVTNSPSVS